MGGLHADELECLVEFLQIVDQKMGPGSIYCLHLADDAFLKIKTTLPPTENLCHRRFSLQRTEHRMTHRAMLQVNFTVTAARLERKATAALAQTAHLQDFRGGKLIEIADKRMARIDSFGGRAGRPLQRLNKL